LPFITYAAEAEVVFPGVAEIIPMSSQVAEKAAAITAESIEQSHVDYASALKSAGDKQQILNTRIEELGDPANWGFERLIEVRGTTSEQKKLLATQLDAISARLATLDAIRLDWEKQAQFWQDWSKNLKKEGGDYPREEFSRVPKDCKKVLEIVGKEINKLLAVQLELSRMQDLNLKTLRQIDAAITLLRRETFKKTAVSLLAPQYYAQFTPELWQQVVAGWNLVTWINPGFIAQNWWVVLVQIFIMIATIFSIRRYRPLLDNQLRWTFLTGHPIATGIFVALAAMSYFYSAPSVTWRLYLTAGVLISAGFLVSALLEKQRMTVLYSLFTATYLLLLFVQTLSLPLPLLRLYLVMISLAGIPLLTWYCYTNRRLRGPRWQRIGLRTGSILLTASLVAQLGGYSTFSLHLVDSAIKTSFVLVMALFAYRLSAGGVYFLLESSGFFKIPLRTQQHAQEAQARLLFLVKVIIIPLTALYLIQIWSRTETLNASWQKLNSGLFTIGEVEISLSSLFSAVLVLYLAFTLSWLLRMILDSHMVGAQFNQRGLGDSVKTLLHYVLVVFGSFFALSIAGIEMKNLAVIAGALSIGIGFGLQNIVNNFVSGLILLFERPVKLGDLIILDGEWAIVRKIGLRSTIIETFSNSEVIVPNNLLISEKLTNLTLSNCQARVRLPVGVAYGSDMDQVLAILLKVASENQRVLKYPEPICQFIGFGNSSLDFELKIWIDSARNGLDIRSEVGRMVYYAFKEEGIEIPFPQQDLHLRSVSPVAADAMRSATEQQPQPTIKEEQI
jgi:small-conductance mechanosensitive channel